MSSIVTPPSLSMATRRMRRLPALVRSTASRSSPRSPIGPVSSSARRSLVSAMAMAPDLPAVLLWCSHPSATRHANRPSRAGPARRPRIRPWSTSPLPALLPSAGGSLSRRSLMALGAAGGGRSRRERLQRRQPPLRRRRRQAPTRPTELAPDVAVATQCPGRDQVRQRRGRHHGDPLPGHASPARPGSSLHRAHEASLADAVPERRRRLRLEHGPGAVRRAPPARGRPACSACSRAAAARHPRRPRPARAERRVRPAAGQHGRRRSDSGWRCSRRDPRPGAAEGARRRARGRPPLRAARRPVLEVAAAGAVRQARAGLRGAPRLPRPADRAGLRQGRGPGRRPGRLRRARSHVDGRRRSRPWRAPSSGGSPAPTASWSPTPPGPTAAGRSRRWTRAPCARWPSASRRATSRDSTDL